MILIKSVKLGIRNAHLYHLFKDKDVNKKNNNVLSISDKEIVKLH